jgi:hypothetical protein
VKLEQGLDADGQSATSKEQAVVIDEPIRPRDEIEWIKPSVDLC